MSDFSQLSQRDWDTRFPGLKRPSQSSIDITPMKEYEAATQKARQSAHMPGCCSIAIFKDQLLHVGSFGKADLEHGGQMTIDSVMRLYCLTKPLVATGLMILVESGKCRLDDEVAKYIPEFRSARVRSKPGEAQFGAQGVKLKQKLTLRRLLTHCSGLGYGPVLGMEPSGPAEAAYARIVESCDAGRISSLKQLCEALAEVPLRFQPGEKYFYSYGLDVIGRVIEVVSKRPLDQFLKEEIFDPVGMKNTGFSISASSAKQRLVALYASPENKDSMGEPLPAGSIRHKTPFGDLVRVDGDRPELSAWVTGRSCPVLSGGGIMGMNRGGIVSTLYDQTLFYLMLLRGGRLSPERKRILRSSTISMMWSADWLTDKRAVGKKCRDGRKVFGWHALGETGIVKRPKREHYPDFFQFGQWGMAGAACTHVTVDLQQQLLCLWFTQTLEGWPGWPAADAQQNLWAAARKVVDPICRKNAAPDTDTRRRRKLGDKKVPPAAKRIRSA